MFLSININSDRIAMECDLGENVFMSVRTFNGQKNVHIRKYELKKDGSGGKYPTKTGVCLSPKRYVSLLVNIDNIDAAYKFVNSTEDAWRTVHIGGELYASVTNGFKCINLRFFFKSPTGKVLPGRQGIALTLPVWTKLKSHAYELRTSDEELENATLCLDSVDHSNQMGFFECPECSPFVGPLYTIGAEDTVALPPMYNSSVDVVDTTPPPTKKFRPT
jgi:hypothetical protein